MRVKDKKGLNYFYRVNFFYSYLHTRLVYVITRDRSYYRVSDTKTYEKIEKNASKRFDNSFESFLLFRAFQSE